MKKLKINKRIAVAIILSTVIVFFLFMPTAEAQIGGDPTMSAGLNPMGPALNSESGASNWLGNAISGVAAWFFRLLGSIFIGLAGLLLNIAVTMFETVLKEGFNGHPEIAEIGWRVCRDIANMFFILFMVVIAFATILRFEKYGVKQLLPRLIAIALLINFSMVFCFVLIDITNIAADFFIKNARTNAAGQETKLSKVFVDGLQVSRNLTGVFCEQYKLDEEACPTTYPEGTDDRQDKIDECERVASKKFDDCAKEMEAIQKQETENESLLQIIITQIGSVVILFIAAFIILAGTLLLVIRSVAIWFLVIISPLAFICFILPSLQKHWKNWLEQFTRWCIFAPAYAFFIWLTATIIKQGTIDRISAQLPNEYADRTALINQFFSDIKYIYNFIFIGAFLIGGLIAANKLGIAGASAAMSVGKKWTGAAKGWVKRQTLDRAGARAKRAGGAIVGGTAGAIAGIRSSKLFSGRGKTKEERKELKQQILTEDSKVLRRMQAKGAKMKQTGASYYDKKLAEEFKYQSDGGILKEAEAGGIRGFNGVQEALRRGLYKQMDESKESNKKISNAVGVLEKFGNMDGAKQLEETRPEIIKDENKQEKTIVKLAQEGNIDKIAASSLLNAKLMAKLVKLLSADDFKKVTKSKQHKENAGKTLDEMTDTGPITATDPETIAHISASRNLMSSLSATDKDKILSNYASYGTRDTFDIDRLNTAQQAEWAKSAGVDNIKGLRFRPTTRMSSIVNVMTNIPLTQLPELFSKWSHDESARKAANTLRTPGIGIPTQYADMATNDPVIKNIK